MTPQRGTSILRGVRAPISSLHGGPGSMIRGAGFWTAILLPVLYVPLLLIGNSWVVDLTNFAKVIALHVASLAVGRGHAGHAEAE